ncbi:hypothetical protein AALO_G00090160, partial [Alosa alosa]
VSSSTGYCLYVWRKTTSVLLFDFFRIKCLKECQRPVISAPEHNAVVGEVQTAPATQATTGTTSAQCWPKPLWGPKQNLIWATPLPPKKTKF